MATCKTWQEIQIDMMKIIAKAKAGELSSKAKQYSCGDGLYICVNNNTAKATWRARVYGVKGACSLGEFSLNNNRMTLATAREKIKALRANHQQEKKEALKCPTVWRFYEDAFKAYKFSKFKSDGRKADLEFIFSGYLKALHNVALDELDCGMVNKAMNALNISIGRKRYAVLMMTHLMDYAKCNGIIKINPLEGLTKLYQPPKAKHRVHVDADEYNAKVLEPFKNAPIFFRAIALLLTFTAFRAGEVINLKWSYIDGKRKILTIPSDAVGANKHGRGDGTGNDTRKQLTPHVCEILQYFAKIMPFKSDFICQSPFTKKEQAISDSVFRTQWNKYINADSKVADRHGVRNTVWTYLRDQGYDWETAELALTHSIKHTGNAQAYDGRQLDEKVREALSCWEDYIYKQLSPEYLEILKIGADNPIKWK